MYSHVSTKEKGRKDKNTIHVIPFIRPNLITHKLFAPRKTNAYSKHVTLPPLYIPWNIKETIWLFSVWEDTQEVLCLLLPKPFIYLSFCPWAFIRALMGPLAMSAWKFARAALIYLSLGTDQSKRPPISADSKNHSDPNPCLIGNWP